MQRRSASGALWALLLCSAALHLFPGCSKQEPPPKEFVVSGDVITIRDTTNARIGPQLEIGAGNFWEEKDRGLTAGLWILTRDADGGTPQQQHIRVQRGQELTVASYRLKVLEIMKGSSRDNPSFVKLDVVKPQ